MHMCAQLYVQLWRPEDNPNCNTTIHPPCTSEQPLAGLDLTNSIGWPAEKLQGSASLQIHATQARVTRPSASYLGSGHLKLGSLQAFYPLNYHSSPRNHAILFYLKAIYVS